MTADTVQESRTQLFHHVTNKDTIK